MNWSIAVRATHIGYIASIQPDAYPLFGEIVRTERGVDAWCPQSMYQGTRKLNWERQMYNDPRTGGVRFDPKSLIKDEWKIVASGQK